MQSTDTAARLSDIEKEELAFNTNIQKRSADADKEYNSYKTDYEKKKTAEGKEFSDEEKSLLAKIAASTGVKQFDLQAELNQLRKKKKSRDAQREQNMQAEKRKYEETKKKIAIEQQDKKPYLTAEKAALKANLQREEAEKKTFARKEAQINQEAQKKQAQAERTLSADKAQKEKERIAQEQKKKTQALDEEKKKYWEKRRQEETARRAKVEQQQKQLADRRAAEAKAWKEAEARRISKFEAEQKAINDKMRLDDERQAAEDKRLRQKLAAIVTSQEDCGCDLKCMPGWGAAVDVKVTDKTGESFPVRQGCFKDKPAKHIEYTNTSRSAKLKVRLCFKRWDESSKAYVWRNWQTSTLKPGESAGDWSCETNDYRLYQKKEGEVAEKKEEKGKPKNGIYKVGDEGPAGGYIFYDKGFYSNGWRYLEAAPVNKGAKILWGCRGKSIPGARAIAIGSGKNNTKAIVENCEESNIAAKYAIEYQGGGKNDWFLPSKDELYLIYINLAKKGIGNYYLFFKQSCYWSSSEYNDLVAWYMHLEKEKMRNDLDFMPDGSRDNGNKDYFGWVIPVRAF